MEVISSRSNKKIKNLVLLMNKAKERKSRNIFIAEGSKMFMEAPGEKIREVYLSRTFFKEEANGSSKLWEKISKTEYQIIEDDIFRSISDTSTPQGILFAMERFSYSEEELLQKKNPLFMILENIQDPGNLGTIMRTAEAAGVSGVIMTSNTVDIYNHKTIRSTMGAIYRMPFIYTEDIGKTIFHMKENGITIYAAHLGGEKNHVDPDYNMGSAFLIGNEGNGLTEEIIKYADLLIKIPMAGQAESLNAAVAASILMYEAVRQRM